MISNESNKSNRGGSRKNAGRKPSSREVKKTAIVSILLRASSGKKMPLDIMFEAMDSLYEEGGAIGALAVAIAAAPYVHARAVGSGESKLDVELKSIEVEKRGLELIKLRNEVNGSADGGIPRQLYQIPHDEEIPKKPIL